MNTHRLKWKKFWDTQFNSFKLVHNLFESDLVMYKFKIIHSS